MKVLHTSDLHLGKRVHGYSMAEDQAFILDRIADAVSENRPDALLVAGDVYDRAVPTEEAVTMFGDFLEKVTDMGCQVYIISGNHDSGPRLGFCGPLLHRNGVHIAGAFEGRTMRLTVEDDIGEVDIHLLPYFRVSEVRCFLQRDVHSYGEAMAAVLEASDIDPSRRSVLVAHQFFAGSSEPAVSDSEEQRIAGGIECIPASLLDGFDYVALGHLHIPQPVGRDTVRYSGSPLKYSASEAFSPKGLVMADIRGKGDVSVSSVPLKPLRDLRVLRGRAEDIVRAGLEEKEGRDDYIIAELSETPGPTGASDLKKVYPRTMSISVKRSGGDAPGQMRMEPLPAIHPCDMFAEFYRKVTGEDLTEYQREILEECIGEGGGCE